MDRRTVRFVLFFLRAHPARSACVVALLLFAGLAEGAGLLALLPVLQLATAPAAAQGQAGAFVVRALATVGLSATLPILLALIVAAMTLKGALIFVAMQQVGYTMAAVGAGLRSSLIRAWLYARPGFLADRSTGEVANAVSTEAHRAAWAFRDACAAMAGAFQVAVYGVVLLLVAWRVALAAVVAGVLLMLCLRRILAISRGAGDAQTAGMKSLVGRLVDLLPAFKALKAMRREAALAAMMEADVRRVNLAQRQAIRAWETVHNLREPFLTIVLAAGLYLALGVFALDFALVLLLAAMFYRIMLTFGDMQSQLQIMLEGESAFWSLREQITAAEAAAEPAASGAACPPTLRHELRLDRVSAGYGGPAVLDRVSLTLPAGGFYAVVGASGVGKTTLIDVVLGLHPPDAGQVLVDGAPLDSIDRDAWRRGIGYVPQRLALLHDSVRRNVALGEPDLDDHAVEQALRAAGAWSFVSALPGGLDHVVGEAGAKLSGGQGQRLAIARALVRQPRLLVLDEATANLDPAVEREILHRLRDLPGGVTILAVSHQPAVREVADAVIELAPGAVQLRRAVPAAAVA